MILEVTGDHIAQMNDLDLRTLVGYLCEQEVLKHHHSPSVVTWGGHQDAQDGGIDVRVSLPAGAVISGYVPKPQTVFQVKARDMPRNAILREMAPDGVPIESVAALAQNGGAYVIVSSKGSLSDGPLQNRLRAMKEAIAALSGSLTVDFYDRRRIASWVNQHPGLVPWVRVRVGQPLRGWRAFGDWSSSPTAIEQPYFLDERARLTRAPAHDSPGMSAADGIAALRGLLAQSRGVVRLVGLSGVGKTRLIQALFDERIGLGALPRAHALYADMSDEPDPLPLEMLSGLIQFNHRVVLIVDNCGVELHGKLAAQVARSKCVLSVITVEYDINDDEPDNTEVFKLEPASEALMEKILEVRYPAIAAPSRRVIAQFSAGNSRVAFALAETAGKGESLANLNDSELFRRLFEQAKGASEELFDAAKACALLYSFDGETLDENDSELVPLAKLAGMTAEQLHKHVAELRRRQLVQRRGKWRAILPHALAHRLARRALEDIPLQRVEEIVVRGRSGRMLRSFSRRMGYLHDDERAVALAAGWFAEGGLLAPLGNLSDLGEDILQNIAPVDPAATLAFFERAAIASASFFAAENENRKQIIGITRSIAYDPALFDRCVELLKRFALSEKPKEDDSAIDPLKSLFHLLLSGTHATPAQRARVVRALMQSTDEREAKLGVVLLEAMLQTGHFSSHYSFEFGARKRDYGAQPHRNAEVKEWFACAIAIARTEGMSQRALAPAVRRLVASQIPELLARTGTMDEVVAVADAFAGTTGWSEGWIGVRRALRQGKDRMAGPVREKLEQLEQRLRPNNLTAMLRSYALSPEWGSLDIADFDEDEEQKPFEARQRIHDLCEKLGQQLANDLSGLEQLLPEIIVAESQKTFVVGRGLATACESLVECWAILKQGFLCASEGQRRVQLLSGFLAGAMQRSPKDVEDFLDDLLRDSRFHKYLVLLQANAGITSAAFKRLSDALDAETVPIDSFVHLAGGRAHEGLDDDQLRSLIAKITLRNGGSDVAAQILGMRIFGRTSDKLPVGETIKLAGREFLAKVEFGTAGSRLDYMLGEIAEASFDRPEHEDQVRLLCGRILESIEGHELYAWDVGDILRAITKKFPVAILDTFVEPPPEGMRYSIFPDMRNHQACPLDDVPLEVWSAWAAEKPDSRYIDLARVVKFSTGNDDEPAKGWSPVAEKLIDSAPQPAGVLDAFFDRFDPSSWSGSRAEIMATRVPLLESLVVHRRPEVAAWGKAKLPALGHAIKRERDSEARESRSRDETFE